MIEQARGRSMDIGNGFIRATLSVTEPWCQQWTLVRFVEVRGTGERPGGSRWMVERQSGSGQAPAAPVRVDWADAAICPAVDQMVTGLQHLTIAFRFEPPPIHKDQRIIVPVLHAPYYSITADSFLADRSIVQLTVGADDGQVAEWARTGLRRIDGCWHAAVRR